MQDNQGNTVIGYFDNAQDAQNALEDLVENGFDRNAIQMQSDATGASGDKQPESEGIGGFFSSLFGTERSDRVAHFYDEGVRRGGSVVIVNADDDAAVSRISDILERYDAVDIDERAAKWSDEGWTGYTSEEQPRMVDDDRDATVDARPGRDDGVLEVMEEDLQVGKRKVESGRVRVYNRVTETPVEQDIQLRTEHISVERRPVDRPISSDDVMAFEDQTLEMTETAEEAVVAKRARVVEEVVISKDVKEHTETVRDTVRRTDVEVEQVAGDDVTSKSNRTVEDR